MTPATLPLEPETETMPNTQALTILQRAVCLTLECHYLGNNRKVSVDDLVEAATGEAPTLKRVDEDQFHAVKRLVDPKELRPVSRVLSKAKAFLRGNAISAHRVFGERTYLIPLVSAKKVNAGLKEIVAELRIEAKALAGRYATAVAKQSVKLGPKLFKADEYVDPKDVETSFDLSWRFVSFASPERLETVDVALAEESNRQYEEQMSQMYDEVVLVLRNDALKTVQQLKDRLTPGEDGKPKVLRGTALRDLQDYIESLPARNLTGDKKLVDAMAHVQQLAQGLDVDTLRDDKALRARLHDVAAQAESVLVGLVETGRRAMSLTEGLTAE